MYALFPHPGNSRLKSRVRLRNFGLIFKVSLQTAHHDWLKNWREKVAKPFRKSLHLNLVLLGVRIVIDGEADATDDEERQAARHRG